MLESIFQLNIFVDVLMRKELWPKNVNPNFCEEQHAIGECHMSAADLANGGDDSVYVYHLPHGQNGFWTKVKSNKKANTI